MIRSQLQFPTFAQTNDLGKNLKSYWEKGLFDEYADCHFLMRLFNNNISSLEWEEQLVGNNSYSTYTPMKEGKIDFDSFSANFLCNFGMKLRRMECAFGEKPIHDFISGQMAAGKSNYSPDAFFQALSEIEILSYFLTIFRGWSNVSYEPKIGSNGANPEACFSWNDFPISSTEKVNIRINVEVKTPGFPTLTKTRQSTIIPAVLLSQDGRKQVKEYANDNSIRLIEPRVTKLVQFLNSATEKFCNAKEGDINLLFINWSYSDFPSNSFLEPWSLLTNETNGIITHKEIGTALPFDAPVNPKAYEKITAIIVYTDSLEQLMFGDFRYVFQTSPKVGPRFRVYLNEGNISINPFILKNNFLFNATGMRPSPLEPKQWRTLNDPGDIDPSEYEKLAIFNKQITDIYNIVEDSILKSY